MLTKSTASGANNNANSRPLDTATRTDVVVDEEKIAIMSRNDDDISASIIAEPATRPDAYPLPDNGDPQDAHVEAAPTCTIAWTVDDDVRLAEIIENPVPSNNDPPRDDGAGDDGDDGEPHLPSVVLLLFLVCRSRLYPIVLLLLLL